MMTGMIFRWILPLAITSGVARAADTDAPVRVIFVGDVMLDRVPGREIARGADPFQGVAGLFESADLVVGNLECVVATGGEPLAGKNFYFRAHPRCLPFLTRHFHVMSLANNHTRDYSEAGLQEMLDRLEQAKLPIVGAGRNIAQARAPLILERRGVRIALLAYNDFQRDTYAAGPETPGVAPCVEDQMVADIRSASARADVVIPFLHWGREDELHPTPAQKELARSLIRAGAAAVIGSHPHAVQDIEVVEGHPVVYSMGNFVFDDFNEHTDPEAREQSRVGCAIRLSITRQGGVTWEVISTRTDDRGFPQILHDSRSDGDEPARGSR